MRIKQSLSSIALGLTTTFAFVTAAYSAPTETIVTIGAPGQTFVGTLALTDGAPAPVVLLLHGFSGARDELGIPNTEEGVFSHTAKKLADAGFSSLRIDFRGSGDSLADINFEDTTFSGQLNDAQTALAYLADLDTVDSNAIYVIGWSQGGLVASGVADSDVPVKGVALWQAVAFPEMTYKTLIGDDVIDKAMAAKADEVITVGLPWGFDVSLKGAFFDEFATYDPLEKISAYQGPLFVTTGDKDTIVTPAAGQAFLDSHKGPEMLWVEDMDHAFDIFIAPNKLDAMIDATIDFFKSH